MKKVSVILIFTALFCLSCATDSFGVYHTVKKGENITKISKLYNVDANELRQGNSIPEGIDELKEGSTIFIPGADKVIETEPAETLPEKSPDSEPEPVSGSETTSAPEPKNENGKIFIWPARGQIVSNFNTGTHNKNNGIDIRFEQSTEIRAAAGGKVVYSGHNTNHGNLLVISHNDSFYTVYSNLSTITAKEGETLKQSDILGTAEATEQNPQPTLHFEIRQSSEPVDPMLYLPEI